MAKTITFGYKNVDYTLEFNRRSVEKMEASGFSLDDISNKPATTIPKLFAGAFLMHHKFVKTDLIDEIYSALPNKNELFQKLVEMYNEPLEALLSEPEDDEGNLTWGASW